MIRRSARCGISYKTKRPAGRRRPYCGRERNVYMIVHRGGLIFTKIPGKLFVYDVYIGL